MIIPDITNPFLVKIVKGVEKTLSAAGYTPILCDTEESPDKEERYLADLMERRPQVSRYNIKMVGIAL